MAQESSEGRAWGIGLGLVVGIILSILSLSSLPLVVGDAIISWSNATRGSEGSSDRLGEPRVVVRRQSFPVRQNQVEQMLPEWPQLAVSRPSEQPAHQAAAVSQIDTQSKLNADSTAPPRAAILQRSPPSRVLSPVVPPPQQDLVDEEPRTLLNHARFLIKAGLAPMAADTLRKVVKEAPGSPIAREAQQTLDSISRN